MEDEVEEVEVEEDPWWTCGATWATLLARLLLEVVVDVEEEVEVVVVVVVVVVLLVVELVEVEEEEAVDVDITESSKFLAQLLELEVLLLATLVLLELVVVLLVVPAADCCWRKGWKSGCDVWKKGRCDDDGGPGPAGGTRLLMDWSGVSEAVGLLVDDVAVVVDEAGGCCMCGFTMPVRPSPDPVSGRASSLMPNPTAVLEGVPRITSL